MSKGKGQARGNPQHQKQAWAPGQRDQVGGGWPERLNPLLPSRELAAAPHFLHLLLLLLADLAALWPNGNPVPELAHPAGLLRYELYKSLYTVNSRFNDTFGYP